MKNNKVLIITLIVLLAVLIILASLLIKTIFKEPTPEGSDTTISTTTSSTTTTTAATTTTTTTTSTTTTTTTTSTTGSSSQNPPEDGVMVYDIFLYDVDPDNDGYRILGIDPDYLAYQSPPREIVVPQKINGKQVTAIGNSAFSIDTDKIVLPEGLIDIYTKAFYQCRATEINIPSTVIYIGSAAFQKCHFLKSITLPTGVDTVRDYTFRECTYLESVTFEGTITYVGHYAFAQCQTLTTLRFPKNCEVESTAFNYSPNLNVEYK